MSDYYIVVIVYILIDDVWYVFYIFVCIYFWGAWVRRAREANVKFIILSALNVGPLAYMPVIDEALGVTAPDEIVKEAAEDGYEAPGVVFGGSCDIETAVLLKAVGAAKAWMREASTRSSWYQLLLAATHEANAGRGVAGGDVRFALCAAVGRNFFDETQMEVLQEKIKDDFVARAVAATSGPMSMRTMVLKVETKVQFGEDAKSLLNHSHTMKEQEKECDALAIANIDGGLAIIYIIAAAMLSWAVEIGLWHCCKQQSNGSRPVDGGFEVLDHEPVNGQDYGGAGCRVVSVKKVLEVRPKRVRDGEAASEQPKTVYELWYKVKNTSRGKQYVKWARSSAFGGSEKKISCINMAQLDALLECPFVPRGTIVKLEGLSGATFDVASAVRGVVTAANAACGLRLTEPTPLFKVSGDARGEKRVSHAVGVRTFVNLRCLNASSASGSEFKHSAGVKYKGRMIPVTISLSNTWRAVSSVDSTFKEPLLFAHSAALVVLFPQADDDMVYLVLGLCASQEVRKWLLLGTMLTGFIRAAALDPDEMPDDLWQRHCATDPRRADGALLLPPMVVQEAVAGGFCKGPGVYEKLAPHLDAYAAAMGGLSAASEATAGDLDGVRGDARARTAGAAKALSIARDMALDFAPKAVVKAAPAGLNLADIEKMTTKKLKNACKKAKLSGYGKADNATMRKALIEAFGL